MIYGGINFIAVLVATIASMAFGAVWYSALGGPWMAASGLTKADLAGPDGKPRDMTAKYAVSAVAKFVMAFCFAKLLELMDAISVGNAIAAALFFWIAFIATTLSVNHRFQLRPWSLTVIDGAYWLGVLVIQGVVIGFFG